MSGTLSIPPPNREVLAEGQARLAGALGVREEGMTDLEAADAASRTVAGFLRKVGMPTRLGDLQVPQKDLEAIADDAMEDFFLSRNPRPVHDAAELVELLRGAW